MENRTIRPLSELPAELKALATATLIFAGVAVLTGLAYLDFSHRGVGGGFLIGPADIAATYYGPGVSITTLISLAHIHMLGLLSVFAIVGFIFVHSSFPPGWKIFWSVLPYGAFLVDVSGWFLTKLAPGYVYVVIVGGGIFILALAVMILLSLYDIWLRRPAQGKAPRAS